MARRKSNKQKKRRAGWIVGGTLVMALLVAGGTFAALYFINRNNQEVVGNVATTETPAPENTYLTSGSVTTTIDGKTITYNATHVVDGIDATITSGLYEAASDNEAVFLVINGGSLKIDGDVKISKTGSADFQGQGDDYRHFGVNSAVVVVGDGSSATINGATISSEASDANAVVATNGGTVKISDAEVTTTKDNSRGLHATHNGTIEADGVSVSTRGETSAALATDLSGGTLIASDMDLTTEGEGSPLVYSTGSVSVYDSEGMATRAQVAVIEGRNSVTMEDSEFSANGAGTRNGVDNAAVMLYQSASERENGNGTFTARDCDFELLPDSDVYDETPFFFVTNTSAVINLTDVRVEFSPVQTLILARGVSEWGEQGENGGVVKITTDGLTATNSEFDVDGISRVDEV